MALWLNRWKTLARAQSGARRAPRYQPHFDGVVAMRMGESTKTVRHTFVMADMLLFFAGGIRVHGRTALGEPGREWGN